MGRIKCGGYIIDWWIGDHYPKHVHIYRDGKEIAKIQIPQMILLTGNVNRKLRKIIQKLVKEGKL